MKHRSSFRFCLSEGPNPLPKQRKAASLTGAVASQTVTEACKGKLKPVWNRLLKRNGTCLPDCEDPHVKQRRKSAIVTRWFRVEGPSINGQKVRRG